MRANQSKWKRKFKEYFLEKILEQAIRLEENGSDDWAVDPDFPVLQSHEAYIGKYVLLFLTDPEAAHIRDQDHMWDREHFEEMGIGAGYLRKRDKKEKSKKSKKDKKEQGKENQ